MFAVVFEYVLRAVSWVWDLYFNLMDHFKFGGLMLSLFVAFTVSRFLIFPIIGQANSDTASYLLGKMKGDKASPKNTRIKGQKAIKGSKKK